jgi:DNA invertase Pin-like site-specific DNA recombinase
VSLSEQVDTSTPTGEMVFTVSGAVAELERSLIVERVKAGLCNARARGKRLGRPRRVLDTAKDRPPSYRARFLALGCASGRGFDQDRSEGVAKTGFRSICRWLSGRDEFLGIRVWRQHMIF